MKIFAYGSNMSLKRLKARVPSATKITNGYVEGYELKCVKRSIDGSGKATIIKTNNIKDKVWGVVFEIDESEKPKLDRFEGLNNGYYESIIVIKTYDNAYSAQIYIADDKAINYELNPYEWYKAFILSGAKENDLPENYVKKLETINSVNDLNILRRKENENILKESYNFK